MRSLLLAILLTLPLLVAPFPAAGHTPEGTPKNYCEAPVELWGHDYGPPASGGDPTPPIDGAPQTCNSGPPGDGHSEYALGGAYILVDSGDGVTRGSLACYGEEGHHPSTGPATTIDVVLGWTVPFVIAADLVNLMPSGELDCGDFEMDQSSTCVGTCTVTFPEGLDGSYVVYVGDMAAGDPATLGHVCWPGCTEGPPPCPPEDVCDPIVVDPLDSVVVCIGPTFTTRLETGVGPNGAPLPAGVVDDQWRILATPQGGPQPAYAHGPDPHPSVWAVGTDAGWINHDATDTWGPRGYYTYQRSFTVPSNAYDVRVHVTYAADNQVRFFDQAAGRLAPYPLVHESATNAFDTKTSFSYTLAETGPHALTGRLFNAGSYTGLLVEGFVTGKCRAPGGD